MPRRGAAPRRELAADPVYDSTLVTQVINKVLQRGKRGKGISCWWTTSQSKKEKEGWSEGHIEAKVQLDPRPSVEKILTGWLKQTKLSPTTGGNKTRLCHHISPSKPAHWMSEMLIAASATFVLVKPWTPDLKRLKQISHATHSYPWPRSKHWHHGPHRRRKDHHNRTHPLLHRSELQNRRSAWWCRNHGLDGTRTRARHHYPLCRHNLYVEWPRHQHHWHSWARWLHGWGRTLTARTWWSGSGLWWRRRRRASDRNCLAASRQIRRSSHVLH